MKIYVCGKDELWEFYGRYNPTHVVTLIDPDIEVPYPFGVNILRLDVWDVESTESSLYPGAKIEGEYVPKREHSQQIINFAQEAEPDQVTVVHCYAGISRSTAAALIMLYVNYDYDIDKALEHLLKIRPHAGPNKLICKYADEILHPGKYTLLRAAKSLEDRYLTNKGYFEE